MRAVLKSIGISVLVLVALAVIAYFSLRPQSLRTLEAVDNLTDLEAHLEELTGYNSDSPPGLSLVVVKDQSIVYQKGFGFADEPKNLSATPATVYNYWSMTKPITAIAIFQLYEQGKLNLDTPVTDYLPFFEVTYPSDTSELITIRHLLNHSSGLKNNVPEVVGWVHTDGGQV